MAKSKGNAENLLDKNGNDSGKAYAVGKGKPPKETQFTSENQPANAGRKPSLLKAYIQDNGVSIQDVRLVFKNIIFEKTKEQLDELLGDESQPMLIRAIVGAYLKDFESGRIDIINSILDRIYGKADQSVQLSGMIETASLTPERRKERIAELEAKRKGK